MKLNIKEYPKANIATFKEFIGMRKTPTNLWAKVAGTFAFALIAGLVVGLHAEPANASVSQPTATAKVSFTFDDGFADSLTKAAPTLQKYGLAGTNYVIPGCVGTVGTCVADEEASYLTWTEVTQLQNQYGWEIGSHSYSHPLMTTLTATQLEQEVSLAKSEFIAHGFTNVKAFASPYGDYNSATEAAIAKYHTSHRGFADIGYNAWPYAPHLLYVQQVQAGVTVDTVKAYIDAAKANNTWLILVFHRIEDAASTDPEDYQYNTADLDAIAAYVKAQGIAAPTITDGLVVGQNNLLPESDGLQNGWTTDTPTAVTADNNSHGSDPDSASSIAMTAIADKNAHLFSPQVAITATDTYLISGYANILGEGPQTSEVAAYIDEYDALGTWISGQLKQTIDNASFKDFSFAYNATSSTVAKASLQVILTMGSGISVYLDNFGWYNTTPEVIPPTPPVVTETNILPGGTFTGGLTDGWYTDAATNFAAASDNVSITAPATATNAHLFSPQVAVDSAITYTIKADLTLSALQSGEVAFYLDEYDAAGTWISGQYLHAMRTSGTEAVSFSYKPSSANVAKSNLQVILVGNSGIAGTLDNIMWMAPGSAPAPTPTPTPTPTPGTTVVLENTFVNGIADGWTTNAPTEITADTAGNGATDEVQHSVKFAASATSNNTHLFSPKVAVVNTKTYTLQGFLNILTLQSGEVAFYIDEYDAAGTWISGKYIYAKRGTGSENFAFNYTPTSASVASASLQTIVVGSSGITGYLDSIKWTSN